MVDVLAAIETQAPMLFPGVKGVVVAVSGGVDSMVLLHALQKTFADKKRRLIVGHFDHGLRGQASRADVRLVEKTAKQLGLAFVSERWTKNMAAIKRHGLEMAAREARLGFLARVAKRHRCGVVAMAHHREDQAETFLWRLMRGAGGIGLGGMKALETFPGESALKVARPFLGLAKEGLRRFAAAEDIEHREDASNADRGHLRNRVRRDLLPLLREEFNPEIERAILQSAELVRADAELAREVAQQWLALGSREPFSKAPLSLQRWIVWHQLVEGGLEPGFELIESLRKKPGVPVAIGQGKAMAVDADGRLSIRIATNMRHDLSQIEISPTARWLEQDFGVARIRCRIASRKPATGKGEVLDAGQVGKRVVLRHWRAGDRFVPIGGPEAKLQDLFTNAKVPAAEKRRRVLACTEDGVVFWVQGLRIGEVAKVRRGTRQFLRWDWVEL